MSYSSINLQVKYIPNPTNLTLGHSLPAGQSVQLVWPACPLVCVPTGQVMGGSEGKGHMDPGGHSVQLRLPDRLYQPEVQAVRLWEDDSHSYPAWQIIHMAIPWEQTSYIISSNLCAWCTPHKMLDCGKSEYDKIYILQLQQTPTEQRDAIPSKSNRATVHYHKQLNILQVLRIIHLKLICDHVTRQHLY